MTKPYPDDGEIEPPEHPPRLRTVALFAAGYLLLVAVLAIGGGALLAWWRDA